MARAINQQILPGTPRVLIVNLGRGIEDDRKTPASMAPSRSTQNDMRERSGSIGFTKGKFAEDVVAATPEETVIQRGPPIVAFVVLARLAFDRQLVRVDVVVDKDAFLARNALE